MTVAAQRGHCSVIKLLLTDPIVKKTLGSKTLDGKTLLAHASGHGQIELVSMLLLTSPDQVKDVESAMWSAVIYN